MRELIRITLVCLCAFLLTVREGKCQDVEAGSSETLDDAARSDSRKETKGGILSGAVRRPSSSSANVTRDSQLLSILAARRRQLLNGRLATHINTLASIANKPYKSNTTFAQLEVRDSNSSVVKRITLDNSSNDITSSLRIVTTDGNKEIRQDVKPHEIRHLFIPKIYQNTKTRAGFMNNRRKDILNATKSVTVTEKSPEIGIVYVPPEKFEGLDKEVEIDPEEEFQVDESNHGLYLLNYSDTDNVTISPLNKTTIANEEKLNNSKEETTTIKNSLSKENITTSTQETISKEDTTESNIIANSTDVKNTKLLQIDNDKEIGNQTLFMTDEIYNHFRPLESELAVEDMAPFLYFGQKLGGQVIADNLTNSPSLSASTKAVNFIVAPLEKRKFNSRYSATETYKNTSVDEEETNEEMDVSVVRNTIEKNKIRNTVKGPAPARHVGLVNAYRKNAVTTNKPLNIAQLNVTEPIVQNITPSTLEKTKDGNKTAITNSSKDFTTKVNNSTTPPKEIFTAKINTTAAPKNFTRSYLNLRRRPSRLTSASSNESYFTVLINSTTEKASTVYTAVVTSVSITSSMKGQNNTNNSTVTEASESQNTTIPKATIQNKTEIFTIAPSTSTSTTTHKPYRHRIRIRTTTTESTLNFSPSGTPPTYKKGTNYPTYEVSTKNIGDLRSEATTSKISERLANLYRQNEYDTTVNGTKNILKRRRPTTTTSTTTISPTTTQATFVPILITTESTTNAPLPKTSSPVTKIVTPPSTTPYIETTTNAMKTFVVTSKTSSESSYKPSIYPINNTEQKVNQTVTNATALGKEFEVVLPNEEVVIEAEKNYTASYVLAGLGFLPVAAVIAFLVRNVLNKKTKELDTEYEGYFDDNEIKKESPVTPVARPPMPTPTKPDGKWEFPRNKLRLQTLLGQGNFGQVWKAEADDLNGHDGLTRLVAVKSIKETASQKEKQELLHEIYIMQKIGTHPNVVTLLACCTEQEPYLLLMEYVMCGKLLTYLRERRSRPDRFSGSGALTSRDLTVFAYCVARGMDYIASKGIVHRDLAARNVLVDHNKLCKIADFGMSRCAGAGARAPRGALPVRWMAPEALLYNSYSHHTDVWAFGILLWEIVTLGSTPYAAMSGREVLSAVTAGYRLERPPHCKQHLYRAMHSCWNADPDQRPSFAELKSQLAELLDNEPSEGNYVDLDSFYQESSVYSDPSAIIQDEDDGLSVECDRERRGFRELTSPTKFDNRSFNFRDEELRSKFGIGTQRMGGFGIRDVPFNERNFSDGEFNERSFNENNFTDRNFNDKNFGERNFSDKNFIERNFSDKSFTERNFADKNFNDKNFNDANYTERKDGKLSTSSFHRERERENPLVSRNSFNGFPRVSPRDGHFQISPDGRNKRVPEFECDI